MVLLKNDSILKLETCPNCFANFKIIERCHECGIRECSNCSIDHLCINCFVKTNEIKERDIYFIEKSKGLCNMCYSK